MTRFEENKMLIENLAEEAERKSAGTYNEMVVFQLEMIAITLADISKSLAILATNSRRSI